MAAWHGCRGSERSAADLEALIRAERAFSRLSEESGITTAFLSYLAEDGVVFRPYPVNGRQWYSERPATEAVLTWEPVIADVSAAGDLGYTTGPWEMGNRGKEPAVFGEYVSVWRKEPENVWRVVVDAGTVHAKTEDSTISLQAVKTGRRRLGWTKGTGAGESGRGAVSDAAREFSRMMRGDAVAAAYSVFAAEEICLLRAGEFPVTGKNAALNAVRAAKGVPVCRQIGEGVSDSDDLGFTYGTRRWTVGGGVLEHEESYLLVWSRVPNGEWRIAIDVSVPIAPPAGEEAE